MQLNSVRIIYLIFAVIVCISPATATCNKTSSNTKLGYGESCTNSSQCDVSKFFYCSNLTCLCLPTYWYNGTACVLKASFAERCSNSTECQDYLGLQCINQTCICSSDSWFWNGTSCVYSRFMDAFSKVNENAVDKTPNFTFHARNFQIMNSKYYVPDSKSTSNAAIMEFDKDWNYLKRTRFPLMYYLLILNGTYYMTTTSGISMTNSTGSQISTFNPTQNPITYRSICFNSVDNTILVVNYNAQTLETFTSLNLTFVKSMSIPKSHGVAIYNHKVYLSTFDGKIAIIEANGTFTNIKTKCTGLIMQITIDEAGVIAVPCYDTGKNYLYLTNGTQVSKTLTVSGNPQYINFDSNGKMAVMATTKLYVFNTATIPPQQ